MDEFIRHGAGSPVIDVRSPSEYLHAHYPGAVSVPLFTDEERKVVGTLYKQQSREMAIKAGLDYFGPKMRPMVEQVEKLLEEKQTRRVVVHCWRGGMRSGAVSWLLDLYGFEVLTLDGGYKAYRNWVLNQIARPHFLRILSGYTGSGKTEILKELERLGQLVLDLEGLAGHRGSAFGHLGQEPQCSNEQFENRLAQALHDLSCKNFEDPAIWVENESSRIGDLAIHYNFFTQMKAAPRVDIAIPWEARLAYIEEGYGKFDPALLISGVQRIRRRLGEANIPLAGGHSIDSPEPVFGLSVNGMVKIKHLKQNNKAREGDLLLLTKPIGVGVLATAAKREVITAEDEALLYSQLTRLNTIGADLGRSEAVHAMTDVTGFGLTGHLIEMAEGSGLSAVLEYTKVPKLEAAGKYLRQNVIPDATYRNWKSYHQKLAFDASVDAMESFQLLQDPQTNGGLLVAVSPDGLADVQQLLAEKGYSRYTEPIGRLVGRGEKTVSVA